ncbi:MAG: hypothetical protein OHK0045_17840 [Raineya sp.]
MGGLSDKEKEIEASIRMLGTFQCPENPHIPIEDFAKINAPAIIFPFVREHLASVSMKAGINAILLPPINFVKMSEKTKKNQ